MRKESLHIFPINWIAESGKRSAVKLLVWFGRSRKRRRQEAELERLEKKREGREDLVQKKRD